MIPVSVIALGLSFLLPESFVQRKAGDDIQLQTGSRTQTEEEEGLLRCNTSK